MVCRGEDQLGGDLRDRQVGGQQGRQAQFGVGQRRRPGEAGAALLGEPGPERLGLADQLAAEQADCCCLVYRVVAR